MDGPALSPVHSPRVLAIARVCHEANRAYCIELGDESQLPWDVAEQWQKDSAASGVDAILSGRVTSPEQSHENWLAEKRAAGWQYGPEKIPARRLHPCFVPYAELPPEQRVKDALFFAVVHALKPAVGSSRDAGGGLYVFGQIQISPTSSLEAEELVTRAFESIKDDLVAEIEHVRAVLQPQEPAPPPSELIEP